MTTLVPTLPAKLSAALASELAMRLEPADAIFARYGIDDATANQLLHNEHFKAMVQQAKAAWDTAENATERVRVKALIAIEELMGDMFERATNKDTGAQAANDIFKTFKSLAGMDQREQAGNVAAGFNFTINLTGPAGAAQEIKVISETNDPTPPQDEFTLALNELIEGVTEEHS